MAEKNGRLAGKVAIVTGGNSGMGAGTVELFVAEGARVVIAARGEGSRTGAGRATRRECDFQTHRRFRRSRREGVD